MGGEVPIVEVRVVDAVGSEKYNRTGIADQKELIMWQPD
jgi:hypothetical protein